MKDKVKNICTSLKAAICASVVLSVALPAHSEALDNTCDQRIRYQSVSVVRTTPNTVAAIQLPKGALISQQALASVALPRGSKLAGCDQEACSIVYYQGGATSKPFSLVSSDGTFDICVVATGEGEAPSKLIIKRDDQLELDGDL